jgi:hypothetical protein
LSAFSTILRASASSVGAAVFPSANTVIDWSKKNMPDARVKIHLPFRLQSFPTMISLPHYYDATTDNIKP